MEMIHNSDTKRVLKSKRMRMVMIPSHSVLAILDRALKRNGLQPIYLWQRYVDTIEKEMKEGLLLYGIEGDETLLNEIFGQHNLHKVGILGFVNGQEPGDGILPLHTVMPEVGDMVSLSYVLEGEYRGDFAAAVAMRDGKLLTEQGVSLRGVHPVLFQHLVRPEDLEKKEYQVLALEA